MAFPIENKLVVAVSSSALFDLTESDRVYNECGLEEYRKYQEENIDNPLDKGVAFPFVKRLLSFNNMFPEEQPVEVVLLSRNSPETGLRVFRTIKHYDLNISRASFFSGESPYKYLPAFNASLFLSASERDVKRACDAGYAAGRVLKSEVMDDVMDDELRIAFDFDGVIADDDSEKIYQEHGLSAFHRHEAANKAPLDPGPLADLLIKISNLQKLEMARLEEDSEYRRRLKISIVTARNAPAHERVVNTLKSWGVEVTEAFFLGGISKDRVLEIMRPHIFFDDQMSHLDHLKNVPAVHIPMGITNE
ncbi:MAG: 5'-nucleotidase [Alistipes sp.]|nr:5'-nucleotidase [Alistipes sp.]